MARQLGRNARLWASLTNGAAPTPIGSTKGFDLNQTRTQIDLTCQGDGSKVYGTGLADSKGSFNGIFDDSAVAASVKAALDGLVRAAYGYMTADLSVYFFGTFFFDASVKTAVDGASEITGSFAAATPVNWVGLT